METCPKCGSHFPASKTWIKPPIFWIMTGWGFLNTNVRCPSCDNVFPATNHRFLGFLSPTQLKALYLTLLLFLLVAGVYQWLLH